MGVHEHKAHSKSDRLIQAMDRLSENIEKLIAFEERRQDEAEGDGGIRPFDASGVNLQTNPFWRVGR